MNYFEIVNSSINYIENHLFDKISTENIASQSYLSKFHFHRIFHALTSYTVKEYIEMRQVSEIAHQLKTTKKSILEIALSSGYNSHEVLTRKFKRVYGLTPNQYRKENINVKPFNKKKLIERELINKKSDLIANFSVKYYDTRYIIGKSCNNGFGNNKRDHHVEDFLFHFAHEQFQRFPYGHLHLVSIYHDKTSNEIEYFVGFDDFNQNSSYANYILQNSKYAIFEYKGVFKDNIKVITDEIYKSIAISGIQLNNINVEFIEVYGEDYLNTGIFQVHVPIK